MINRLQYISQGITPADHLQNISSACDAGCTWVQLRIKNLPADELMPHAVAARRLTARYNVTLIINDHPTVAVAAGADGVHVGLEDNTVAEARAIVGDKMIVGGTSNTWEHIAKHQSEGADYVGLGPYRFTETKKKLSPILGLTGYQEVMQKLSTLGIRIPVIAIGGIVTQDIEGLLRAGVHGIAVSGLITGAPDKAMLVDLLYNRLNTSFACNH
ncbi:thiamine-phosphate diphosphorylase [Chitinophaga jiangningensis]|uniref:Thiamine-phosphate synthase n=1 Tax=Chitinophaga jiangningensis TaxID=1419482 RepID=A0A1M7EBE9_9BACT|nr:thiamine phosphate synthase [Chitinophaga jiangningensis]SHL88669.1 thiamine-phosphate diphosphorylase [Chitinophaga jiangningensis]